MQSLQIRKTITRYSGSNCLYAKQAYTGLKIVSICRGSRSWQDSVNDQRRESTDRIGRNPTAVKENGGQFRHFPKNQLFTFRHFGATPNLGRSAPLPNRIALFCKCTRALELILGGVKTVDRGQLALCDTVHGVLKLAVFCVPNDFFDCGIDERWS